MYAGLANTATRAVRAESGLKEYLLVVRPDAAVCSQMELVEQEFYTDYGIKSAAGAKPHIKVAGFRAQDVMEETLIRCIGRICGMRKSFKTTLNNYGGFPPHTIYLRIMDPLPFIQLGKELRAVDELIRSSWCPPANLVSKPYLGIATRLPEQVYFRAMPDYSGKTFHASFMVDELLLLQKDRLSGACKTINIFRLPPPDNRSSRATA
ncbi:MAG TPA: 2'-5' RNA ligase family protein [Chitinophagaceae bacterium]|jgi:hypothetical protein